MSKSFIELVQFFDFSWTPVSLQVRKKTRYSSTAGGLCSILMIVLVTFVAVMELIKVFQEDPDTYVAKVQTTYLSASNEKEYLVTGVDGNLIPAIQIVDNSGQTIDTMNYLMPYLQMSTKTTAIV